MNDEKIKIKNNEKMAPYGVIRRNKGNLGCSNVLNYFYSQIF